MKIILIDDDKFSLTAMEKFLKAPLGYDIHSFTSCDIAFDYIIQNTQEIEMIISDIKMKGMTGIDLLKSVKSLPDGQSIDIILMTGYGELSTSIEALREGASDYLLKPVSIKQLKLVIERIRRERKLRSENLQLKKEICNHLETEENHLTADNLIGENIGFFSKQMHKIKDLSLKFHSKKSIPVLIEGETGTGKEVIAKLIHNGTSKNNAPFIAVNCSAFSATLLQSELFGYVDGAFTGAKKGGAIGKFEAAKDGTIFLDEIGELPLEMQPVLLRVLQEKEITPVGSNISRKINARIIFATNRNLEKEIQNGTFREDLFYRISTGRIKLPPLRERRNEINSLAFLFMKNFCSEHEIRLNSISRDALYLLQQYHYPGNIRELKNIIERALVLVENDNILRVEHLHFMNFESGNKSNESITFQLDGDKYPLKEMQKEIARKVYTKFNGNINQSAKYLGVAWATFVKMVGINK